MEGFKLAYGQNLIFKYSGEDLPMVSALDQGKEKPKPQAQLGMKH